MNCVPLNVISTYGLLRNNYPLFFRAPGPGANETLQEGITKQIS